MTSHTLVGIVVLIGAAIILACLAHAVMPPSSGNRFDIDLYAGPHANHLMPTNNPHDTYDDGDCTWCTPGREVTDSGHLTWVHRDARDRSISA